MQPLLQIIVEKSFGVYLLESKTGRNSRPCNNPSTTIPKTILKNIRNNSLEAKAVTMIPMKVLSPEMRKLFILLSVQRKKEKKEIGN